MPVEFVNEPSQMVNDPSQLSSGAHYGFLLDIQSAPKNPKWKNYDTHPNVWRWFFALWERQEDIGRTTPELQSKDTEQKFSPARQGPQGLLSASTAYEWTKELLGRDIPRGEHVSLAPLLPIPVRVRIERAEQYARIKYLERWPEGTPQLSPGFKDNLAAWFRLKQEGATQPTPSPVPAPSTWAPAPASLAPRPVLTTPAPDARAPF